MDYFVEELKSQLYGATSLVFETSLKFLISVVVSLLVFLLFVYLAWRLIKYLCRLDRGPDAHGLRRVPLLNGIIWLFEGLLSLFGYESKPLVDL